jgi:hypothetical protein
VILKIDVEARKGPWPLESTGLYYPFSSFHPTGGRLLRFTTDWCEFSLRHSELVFADFPDCRGRRRPRHRSTPQGRLSSIVRVPDGESPPRGSVPCFLPLYDHATADLVVATVAPCPLSEFPAVSQNAANGQLMNHVNRRHRHCWKEHAIQEWAPRGGGAGPRCAR